MHTHSAKQSQCITNGVRDEVINMIMYIEHKISKQKKKSNLLIRFKILYLKSTDVLDFNYFRHSLVFRVFFCVVFSVFGALYSGIDSGYEDEEDDHIEDAKDRQATVIWVRLWACPS